MVQSTKVPETFELVYIGEKPKSDCKKASKTLKAKKKTVQLSSTSSGASSSRLNRDPPLYTYGQCMENNLYHSTRDFQEATEEAKTSI